MAFANVTPMAPWGQSPLGSGVPGLPQMGVPPIAMPNPALPPFPQQPAAPRVQPPPGGQTMDPFGGAYGPTSPGDNPMAPMLRQMLTDQVMQGVMGTLPPLPAPPGAPDAAAAPGPQASAPVAPAATATGNTDYRLAANAAAAKYGLDPAVFAAQINQESGWNPNAVSTAGAIGIAQFMPQTAAGMGIDPTDPNQAIDGAARLMGSYLKKYGSMSLALAAYNAGPGAVDAYLNGNQALPAETQRYITDILGS